MESQKDWRRQALAARECLSPTELADKSAAITERLLARAEMAAGRRVMFYASFRSEVNTWAAMALGLARGVEVVLPVVLAADHRLQPRLVTDLTGQLRPGYCDIPEPDPELTGPVDSREIAVVIVPGSVFDSQGGRVGYGGGFYDRFLQQEAPQALRIGLAFAVQVVAGNLPLADHDQRLDLLITEERVYEFTGNRQPSAAGSQLRR